MEDVRRVALAQEGGRFAIGPPKHWEDIMRGMRFFGMPLLMVFISIFFLIFPVNAAMLLASPGFANRGSIPEKFTCDGKDVSPALSWSHVPGNTRSFALIVDDPDAPDPARPRRTWVHWILYNIPAGVRFLPEGIKALPKGTLQGLNDWGKTGYRGPCPPMGKHRYFFKLYALDTVLPDLHHPTKAALLNAMKGHILEKTERVGVYRRK